MSPITPIVNGRGAFGLSSFAAAAPVLMVATTAAAATMVRQSLLVPCAVRDLALLEGVECSSSPLMTRGKLLLWLGDRQ